MADVLTQNQFYGSPQTALVHYGKKGMKWGVITKEPPSGARSSTTTPDGKKINVKKAEAHEANAARAQQVIDKVKANPSKWGYIQRQRDENVRQLEIYRDKEKKAAEDVREGHLTDSQKKVLTGLAVAGTVLAAYGAYKYVDSGTFAQNKADLGAKVRGQEFAWKKKDSLAKHSTEDDIFNNVVRPINPDFGDIGTKMNCRRCTFAYELRRRGYDVKAGRSVAATGQTPAGLLNAINPDSKLHTGRFGMIFEAFKEGAGDGGPLTNALNSGQLLGKTTIFDKGGAAASGKARANSIFESLYKEPTGARGEFSVGWSMGGAHSMAWENIGGRVVVFDAQTGKKYSSASDFEGLAKNVNQASYTRLDNLTLNEEFLKRWLRNAD